MCGFSGGEAMGMSMFGMAAGMLIWTVLLVALIAVAVVLAVRGLRPPNGPMSERVDRQEDWAAEDQVRMRYARGELKSQEFRERMQELRDN